MNIEALCAVPPVSRFRRVPQAPLHCFVIPWQFHYNCALPLPASYCFVSHIRREPEAETKDVAGASEEAAAEQQKQQITGSRQATTKGRDYDKKAAKQLEAARREATLRPRSWLDLGFS